MFVRTAERGNAREDVTENEAAAKEEYSPRGLRGVQRIGRRARRTTPVSTFEKDAGVQEFASVSERRPSCDTALCREQLQG